MKMKRYDIFTAYTLLYDLEICKSEHVFSVEFLGRSRTYLAYLRSSKNHPNIESLVFLAVKLMSVSAGLIASEATTKDVRREADVLRQGGGDILRLAMEQAQALAYCDVMLPNNTSLEVLESCAVKPLGK